MGRTVQSKTYFEVDEVLGKETSAKELEMVDCWEELGWYNFEEIFKPNLSLNDLEIFDVINL
ncbi:hypothetical protein UNDYM_2277 [Undibacterium sp. YM2]|nr:hypothetical protein UNDYM_2277 [Undibacterium sp. YM2]